jgi:hypothetical protein
VVEREFRGAPFVWVPFVTTIEYSDYFKAETPFNLLVTGPDGEEQFHGNS